MVEKMHVMENVQRLIAEKCDLSVYYSLNENLKTWVFESTVSAYQRS